MSEQNVRDFGAVGDGVTLATAAIQKAIDTCAQAGGGVVRLSAGIYLSATLRLRPYVTLHLEAGATLKGVSDPEAYASPNLEGRQPRWHRALILAQDAEHAGIVGPGTLDGSKVFDPWGEEKMRGPHTIHSVRSQHFFIRDVTVRDSANYAILAWQCDDLEVHNVTVHGGWDGFHIRGSAERSCQRVTVTACRFYTGDDAIAGTWVDDLLISDCLLNSSCNGIRWIGPARRMIIDQCLIFGPGRYPHITQSRHNTLIGITLQPGAWEPMPGELDRVQLSNITMHHVDCALMVFNKPGSTLGSIEVNRLTATGVDKAACSFENWSGETRKPGDRGAKITLRDSTINHTCASPSQPPVEPVSEPRHGCRPLPAWGLYARALQQLTLENVRFASESQDPRPLILLDQVQSFVHDQLHYPDWIDPSQVWVQHPTG